MCLFYVYKFRNYTITLILFFCTPLILVCGGSLLSTSVFPISISILHTSRWTQCKGPINNINISCISISILQNCNKFSAIQFTVICPYNNIHLIFPLTQPKEKAEAEEKSVQIHKDNGKKRKKEESREKISNIMPCHANICILYVVNRKIGSTLVRIDIFSWYNKYTYCMLDFVCGTFLFLPFLFRRCGEKK